MPLSTKHNFILVHVIFQLLIQHGIKELFLTSDGIVDKTTGYHVAPFYNGIIHERVFNFLLFLDNSLISLF